jgi:hypothetical protein
LNLEVFLINIKPSKLKTIGKLSSLYHFIIPIKEPSMLVEKIIDTFLHSADE